MLENKMKLFRSRHLNEEQPSVKPAEQAQPKIQSQKNKQPRGASRFAANREMLEESEDGY